MPTTIKFAGTNTLAAFLAQCDERYLSSANDAYEIRKETTPTTGYAATYKLYSGGTAVGTAIDIPKDYLVRSAELKTHVAGDGITDVAYQVGDKYIDFVVNTAGDDGNISHIYLRVADLVDTYTAGNGIAISSNSVAVTIDSTNANGLSVGANGVALSTATTSAAGAMSSTDKTKLDSLPDTYTEITTAEVQALFA